MKVMKICLILLCALAFNNAVLSQQKTKIVVVEKVTDENGKIIEKRIVKEGAEAEEYMKAKKAELGIELEEGETSKTIKKEMEVEMEALTESTGKKMRIKVLDENGEAKEFEWDGEGEMPEEMKKYMEEEEMDIDVDVDEMHETIEIKISDMEKEMEDGENVEIRIMKEGEKDVQQKIIVKEYDKAVVKQEARKKVMDDEVKEIEWVVKSSSRKEARLGISPVNHVEGVEISAILEDYPAAKSELQLGDVIYQINDMNVGSTIQLQDRLKKIAEGDTATFHILRNGERKMIKVKL